jgi:hypothetical protein
MSPMRPSAISTGQAAGSESLTRGAAVDCHDLAGLRCDAQRSGDAAVIPDDGGAADSCLPILEAQWVSLQIHGPAEAVSAQITALKPSTGTTGREARPEPKICRAPDLPGSMRVDS